MGFKKFTKDNGRWKGDRRTFFSLKITVFLRSRPELY
jgi:hypothetical protein